jgi:hypothetical protein
VLLQPLSRILRAPTGASLPPCANHAICATTLDARSASFRRAGWLAKVKLKGVDFMATTSELKALVNEFRSMIVPAHAPSPDCISYKIEELVGEGMPLWDEKWNKKQGVYYFCKGEEVVYIGVASTMRSGTLGARVKHWFDQGGGEWLELINDPETVVGLLVFNEKWFWALSLEGFLIERLRPRLNKRFK